MGTLDDQENFCGNDKHFKVLRRALTAGDVRIWNDFSTGMGPHFRADLRGINLENQDLTGIQFNGARLEDANLDGANLTGASLIRATLTRATFRNAVLAGTKLKVPVKVKSNKAPEEASTDPELRRRLKLAKMQEQAETLLTDRKKKEEDDTRTKERVRAKNRVSGSFRETGSD